MHPMHNFVFADFERSIQFARLSDRRGLFRDPTITQDSNGVPWAVSTDQGASLAVSPWRPGWMADPFGREHKAADVVSLNADLAALESTQRGQRITEFLATLRFGPLTEPLLWLVQQQLLESRKSVFRIPDSLVANCLWGSRPPNHWRDTVRQLLKSLTYLHVSELGERSETVTEEFRPFLYHAADRRGSANDVCDPNCCAQDAGRHSHFHINVGTGFLGILEACASDGTSTGVREYTFPIASKRTDATLRQLGKTGQLTNIYLPAKMGDPSRRRQITPQQHRLLQAIMRELTRKRVRERRTPDEPVVVVDGVVRNAACKMDIVCPYLIGDTRYVGFNGNGVRRGGGYLLASEKGWLKRSGYAIKDIRKFLCDLEVLCDSLGLVVVGLQPRRNDWFDLAEMQHLLESGRRRRLEKVNVRVYARENYLDRWNELFRWQPIESGAGQPSQAGRQIARELKQKKVSQKALADEIDISPSRLSRILKGTRPFPDDLFAAARDFLSCRTNGEHSASPSPAQSALDATPTVDGHSTLAIARDYLERGWSIIPQIPGDKKPPIKWKPFQERCATDDEMTAWWAQWPEAGVALITGRMSGVLVIDVDGQEADEVLRQRLGTLPNSPQVISGSEDPYRYHLFFQHPDSDTKAKATPWHRSLEFRGQSGLVILPPSVHKSGNRYRWAPGRSLEDFDLPELPNSIIEALRTPPVSPPAPQPSLIHFNAEALGQSTQEFLSGQWKDGPQWNDRLYRAACDMQARGIPRAEAEAALLVGAAPRTADDRSTAQRTIASAYSKSRQPSQR